MSSPPTKKFLIDLNHHACQDNGRRKQLENPCIPFPSIQGDLILVILGEKLGNHPKIEIHWGTHVHVSLMEFEDMVFETFTHLSAKDIYKYTSVSKACKGFADENLFIKKQCLNMQLKGDSGFFIQPRYCHQRYRVDKLELHSLDAKASIPQTAQEFLPTNSPILASSNGLLCCRKVFAEEGTLFMCNPVTQTWFVIPSPSDFNPSHDYKIVFGCDSGSTNFPHDYTLMIIMEEEDDEGKWGSHPVWKIYSPEQGIWKDKGRVNFGARNINYEMPVYHNGTVHFISDCYPYIREGSRDYWPYIFCLNVTDGTQKLLRIPENSRKDVDDPKSSCMLGIFKWASAPSSLESICLVKICKTKCCVWVLVEDYNKSCWIRKLKKKVQDMGFIEPNPIFAGFTVFNGSLLLLATEERVYSYDLASDEGKDERVKLISGHTCGQNVLFHSYSSTLRPCGNGATTF